MSLVSMQVKVLLYFTPMNKYEIKYKHYDMPAEYVGKATKWARDEKQALGFLCTSKPTKDGYCTTKKGAKLKILSVQCI